MKVLSTLFSLLFSSIVLANPVTLNNIVVFGDSLSDNGNLYEYMAHKIPQSPPYFAGRFSNGPIWVERLEESYYPTESGAHLLDYAFGGAGISEEESDVLMTLKRELSIYLSAHQDKADPNNLYIVWIGANNYIGLPDNVEESLNDVNKGIVSSLNRLADAGAKYIVVVNLPDLGKAPIAKELTAPDAKTSLSYFSTQHNALLLNSVNELKQTRPEVHWVFLDVQRKMNELLESPESYGFTNVTDTCYSAKFDKNSGNFIMHLAASAKLKASDDLCEGYMFFDPVHPTALVHKMLAEETKAALNAEGIDFVGGVGG